MCMIATGEAKETPQKRKRADDGAAEAQSPEELRMEALQLLRKSYVVSQNGIQGTWGEEATFVLNANAIRAWRPIEVCYKPPLLPVLSCYLTLSSSRSSLCQRLLPSPGDSHCLCP